MPSVTEFKRSHDAAKQTARNEKDKHANEIHKGAKRRPGRDEFATEFDNKSKIAIQVTEVDKMTNSHKKPKHHHPDHKENAEHKQHADSGADHEGHDHKDQDTSSEENHVDINFPGSEVLRAKFPKSFEAAENVATDWVNDGKFDHLPLQNPLAKAAVQQGLLKAKEIEKKVMASPLTEKVAVQAFTYAAKAQGFVNNLRSKVQKKNEH
jgi:hypothetical protein